MDALLYELCTKHGWCLPPEDCQQLLAVATPKREAVIEFIMRAELGDATAGDDQNRAWLGTMVDDWLYDEGGRGARSGLPD